MATLIHARNLIGATASNVLRLLSAIVAVLLVTAPAEALDPTRTISQFHHTAWTVRDGMPGNIRAIAQTADGFLWLGTEGGLYRFDGVRIERVDHFGDTPLPLVSVRALLATPDGDLWIGFTTNSATVSRVRGGVLSTFTQKEGLPNGMVEQLVADSAGGVWMVALPMRGTDMTAHFDGKAWQQVGGDFGLRSADVQRGIWGIAVAGDGTVWVKNAATLYFYRPGMPQFQVAPGYTGKILGFARDTHGRVWTADQDQRRLYALPDLSTLTGLLIPPPSLNAPVPENLRGPVIIDRDGTMWCASSRTGVARIRSLTSPTSPVVEQYLKADGLTANAALTLFEDREGNIWVGTINGLDRFRPADIVTEPRIPLTESGPMIRAGRSAVYVYTGQSRTPTRATDGSSSIYRIGADGDPRMVAANVADLTTMRATDNDLVYVSRAVDGGRLTSFTMRDGEVAEPTVFPSGWSPPEDLNIAFDDGTLWYRRAGRGYFRFKDGQESRMFAKTNLAASARNWSDRRWVYFPDGALFEIDGDTVREHRASDFSQVSTEDTDDHRILYGGELGLLEWNGKSFRQLLGTRIPALLTTASLTLAVKGELWIQTQAGIVRTTVADLDRALADPTATLPHRLYDIQDGLPGAPSPYTFGPFPRGPDGRLWLATSGGLAWIDPNRLAHNDLPPPVVVTKLASGDQVYEMPVGLNLKPGTSSLQIDYTALSLTIPERNRFRYRLEGVDPDWIYAGERRQAFYTRLEPGTYRFRIIAANNDGVWNEDGATLEFTIAPTFFQSIWFKFLVGLAVAGLAWTAYAMRLRQQAARLQSRFDVRMAERERIARELHDTLLQSTQGLIYRFQSIANRVPTGSDLRGSIDAAIDGADEIVAEGRSRVHELRSEQPSESLAQSLFDLARRIIPGETPCFSLTVEGAPRPLRAVVGEELLRIAEEAVRNATNHANAKAVIAVLHYGRSELRMSVRDDGDGLPESVLTTGKRAGHFGLIGMRERAQRIGGRFDVKSRTGFGTEIVVCVKAPAAYDGRRSRTPKPSENRG